jgi:membrane-associated phospholipid phosphatase
MAWLHGDGKRGPGVVAGAGARTRATLAAHALAAFVLVEAVLLGLGLVVTRVLDHGSLHEAEVDFATDVLAHRTPLLDQVSRYASLVGATPTVVALTAVGCLVLALRGHGPRLPAFLALAVAGETILFLLASAVLDRARPAISQLDIAPPTSSFPSGHTAATVALWCGLALGLARTRPRHPVRVVGWVLAVALTALVAWSRLYRGMHWPTDVAAGVLFAVVWLLLLRAILLPRDVPDRRGDPGGQPP